MSHPFRSALLAAAATIAVGAGFSTPAAACSDAPYIGATCFIVSQYCPYGYVEANGTLLQIREYQALYSLVGVTFGGDGRNTFGVPNLRGRNPVGWGQVTGMTPVGYGQYVGQEAVMLTQTQMAPHNHPAQFSANTDATKGKYTVTTTAITGSMGVTTNVAALPAAPSGTTQAPAAGSILTAGNAISLNPVKIYAPSGSTGTTVNLGGVSSTVNGSPAIPAFSFDVPTGGSVTVGYNIQPSQQVATPVRDPAVGLTACIAVNGTYPTRP